MLRVGATTALCAGAHWSPPSKEKVQPMIDACFGMGTNANCTAKITGNCTTVGDGQRVCMPKKGKGKGHGHHHAHHGHHGDGNGHHHNHDHHGKDHNGKGTWDHWSPSIGNCDGQADGEECTFEKGGVCFPSHMLANTSLCIDAMARDFTTVPCEDKSQGDECNMKGHAKGHQRKGKGKGKGKGAGSCAKIDNFDKLICKANFTSPCEAKSEGDECTMKGHGKGKGKGDGKGHGKGKGSGRCHKCDSLGELVCKPDGNVTSPCDGKSVGDKCTSKGHGKGHHHKGHDKGHDKGHGKGDGHGQCTKVDNSEHLLCKPDGKGSGKGHGEGHGHSHHEDYQYGYYDTTHKEDEHGKGHHHKGSDKGHSHHEDYQYEYYDTTHKEDKHGKGHHHKGNDKGHHHTQDDYQYGYYEHSKEDEKQEAPSDKLGQAFEWIRGAVPTWWAKDGTPHWTSSVVV